MHTHTHISDKHVKCKINKNKFLNFFKVNIYFRANSFANLPSAALTHWLS